jgi:hypothetical protein
MQAWSGRFPSLEVCPLSGTEYRALANNQHGVPSVPDQDGPIIHRSVTYVLRVPDSSVGLAQSQFRRGADALVLLAAPSGWLRCQCCGGMRSQTYHCRHFRDPRAYPAIGVCSRRWMGCTDMKTLKERSTVDSGTMDCSIAEITRLGVCVGSEVTVVAQEIDVDYVGIRTSVG